MEDRGFLTTDLFYVGNTYKYLKVLCITDNTSLLIDLGRYQTERGKVYSGAYELLPQALSLEDSGDSPEQAEVAASYSEIHHLDNILESEEKALESYHQTISLAKAESKSADKLRGLLRQIKRLSLTVRGLIYKISILEGDCCCVVNSKNEISSFVVKGYRNLSRQILITLSLVDLTKTEFVNEDVNKILSQLYEILNKNQTHQTHKIQTMIDAKKSVVKSSNSLLKLKKQYIERLAKLQRTFNETANKEKELSRKLQQTERTSDLRQSYESDLRACEDARIKIVEEMETLRGDLNHLVLSIDNLLYDNMTMLIRIANNFKILDKLVK